MLENNKIDNFNCAVIGCKFSMIYIQKLTSLINSKSTWKSEPESFDFSLKLNNIEYLEPSYSKWLKSSY